MFEMRDKRISKEHIENSSLVEYKEKKWYQRIFEKIVGMFKKK